MMKHVFQKILVVGCAFCMAVAPGMDFTVQKKALPDGTGIVDMLYQTLARTTAAFSTQSIALAVLLIVFLVLANRTLFHKPNRAGLGEYLLCLFLSGMMLLNQGIRNGDSVALLYRNSFQVIKSALYLTGMYGIFLVALRELNAMLSAPPRWLQNPAFKRVADRQTYWRLCLLLGLFWLPQIFIKYPGVLMWDTFHQIKQFIGDYARTSNHPPFGTLLYGCMAKLGMLLGNVNIVYFMCTLLQAGAFIAVLAYSLTAMQRFHVPAWVRLGAFLLYAVSPCYAGWATVLCKDTLYLILCLMIGTLLLEFALIGLPFVRNRRKMALLSLCMVLLWLTRYNGALVVLGVYSAVLVALMVRKTPKKTVLRMLAYALVTVTLGAGGNEALLRALHVQKIYMYDVYSLPFQQTALVAAKHRDEIPAEEAAVINRVVDYDLIATRAGSWYADSVKDTYRQSATQADRNAYLRVWFGQLLRYPLENLDAALIMNGVLFDVQDNRPMYISLSDNSLTDAVYPYSYNDMTLYNSKEIEPLNAAQRMLTQWYVSFDDLPLVGWFASMGFCTVVMLMLLYLAFVNRRRQALWVFIPSVITLVGCLFSPVAYLRYALPYVCSLPLWFAAYTGAGAQAIASGLDGARAEMNGD